MQHIKTVIVKGKPLEYFITEPDNKYKEYGICAKYDNEIEVVESISSDYQFVYDLAISLVESCTMQDFIEELCEDAIFSNTFIELIEEEKWI